jgi:hypothetical protein
MKLVTFIFSMLLTLSGCTTGLLYTDIVRPECKDLRGTTLGTKVVRNGSYRIDIPTPRIDITAEWDSKAVGDIAKSNGIHTVYACDERTVSILGGLFRKEEIIIYGE